MIRQIIVIFKAVWGVQDVVLRPFISFFFPDSTTQSGASFWRGQYLWWMWADSSLQSLGSCCGLFTSAQKSRRKGRPQVGPSRTKGRHTVDQMSKHHCTQAWCGIDWTLTWTHIKGKFWKAAQSWADPNVSIYLWDVTLPQLSGSLPSSLRETQLARVHRSLSVSQGNLFSLCASFVILRELGQLFKSGNVRGIKRLPWKDLFHHRKETSQHIP